MVMSERVVHYGLVFGLRPRRCLEIGTHRGGSALIIAAALDDLGDGTLSCVDLAPQIDPEDWRAMAHRATLFSAPSSPGVFHEMAEKAGGRFDFALIDGDHSTAGALRDINGMLGVLEDSATIVLHDAHNDEVAQAIRLAVENRESGLIDCGMISTEKSFDAAQGVYWGGMRMLRFSRRAGAGTVEFCLSAASNEDNSGTHPCKKRKGGPAAAKQAPVTGAAYIVPSAPIHRLMVLSSSRPVAFR
jgi:hypothetical protein